MGDNFDVSNLTGFEGYVAGKLDGIEKRLNSLPCSGEIDRIATVEKKVANIEGKAAMIGGIFGLAVAWLREAIWK